MRHAYGALNRVNDLQAFYGRHFAQVPVRSEQGIAKPRPIQLQRYSQTAVRPGFVTTG